MSIRLGTTDPSAFRLGTTAVSKIMLGTTQVWGGSAYDADAQAWFDAIVAAGSTISDANKTAADAFVVGCKTDGIWTAIKQCYLLSAANNLTGALVPLKGAAPTNFGGLFTSDDYSRTTGLIGDGSTKYLSTNFTHATADQNNHSRFVGVSSAPTTDVIRAYFGTGTLSGGSLGLSLNTNQVRVHASAATSASLGTASTATGLLGYSRSGSTTTAIENNGSTTSSSIASTTPTGETISIFARGTGTAMARTNARIYFWLAGDAITPSLLRARLATYYSSLA